MAALTTGSIPQYYREFYDAICPSNSSKIPRPLWVKVMTSCAHLAEAKADEVWLICDPSQTQSLGREQLYKSLALIGLLQKGKPIDPKVFESYGDKELPIPAVGQLVEVRELCSRFVRATNPTELGYSYDEIKGFDEVNVTLLPEKKGSLLHKHNEYTVQSKHFGSSVSRRFNDFIGFHSVLSSRFPYRLIPLLPPKNMFGQSEKFIESRRRALKRFLILVCRHPTLRRDEVVRYFFTTVGQDIGARIKEKYKHSDDEFMFHPITASITDVVTDQHRMKYERVKEQIAFMMKIMNSLLQIGQNFEERTRMFGEDMKQFAKELASISNEPVLNTPWSSGSVDSWDRMRADFRQLSPEFNSFGEKSKIQMEDESNGFSESVALFIDLLQAYQELCIRREKFVHNKHQKALNKVKTMEKYKGHVEAQGKTMSSQHESKLAKHDDELMLLEKRNFFSLFCLDLEAQLISVNLCQLPEMLQSFVDAQLNGHFNYVKLWENIKPIVDEMTSTTKSPTSSLRPGGARPRVLSPEPAVASPFS